MLLYFFNCAIVVVNDFFVFMKKIKIAFKFKELNSCSKVFNVIIMHIDKKINNTESATFFSIKLVTDIVIQTA